MLRGLMYIGDPHLSSTRPGRRLDDYAKTILMKLSQAAKIAREKRLYPVILGDLFHRNKENNLALLNGLVEVAREFPCVPIVLEGNHDKAETSLTDQDALQLMGAMGVFKIVTTKGFVETIELEEGRVNLWASPYGSIIDSEIQAKEGFNVMITHHDLAFAGAYPGAALLKEISGCDMVVNGHMHKTSNPVKMGRTIWHNPGNIARLSVDTVDHEPAVWGWYPKSGVALEKYLLHFEKDVFDMTGLQVTAATPAELKKTLPRMLPLSQFAALLKVEETLEAPRSEDGAMAEEELRESLDSAEDVSDALRAYLSALAKAVKAERTN